MRTAEERFSESMEMCDMQQWFDSRPDLIKEMIRKYPFGEYRIAEGAPYGITCPGSIVLIHTYRESGEIGVLLTPDHFLPAALDHIRNLCNEHKKDYNEMIKGAHLVYVDPKYLEPTE